MPTRRRVMHAFWEGSVANTARRAVPTSAGGPPSPTLAGTDRWQTPSSGWRGPRSRVDRRRKGCQLVALVSVQPGFRRSGEQGSWPGAVSLARQTAGAMVNTGDRLWVLHPIPTQGNPAATARSTLFPSRQRFALPFVRAAALGRRSRPSGRATDRRRAVQAAGAPREGSRGLSVTASRDSAANPAFISAASSSAASG